MSHSRVSHASVEALRSGRFSFGLNTQSYCYHLGRTLIDTGPPAQWKAVREFVMQMAAKRGIDRVVVTHHHEDHAGNAGRIAELLDVPVLAPEKSLAPLREGYDMELYRRIVWGGPGDVEAETVPQEFDAGEGLTLVPIPAPGHADDMVCYFVPERGWLFTADLFIVRRPEYLRYDENVSEIVESIHRVLQVDVETLFCGHRGVIEDGRTALREKARYLEALCGVAQQRYRQDKRSVDEIRDEMLGKEGMLRWISGGDFSKHNLIASCVHDTTKMQALDDLGSLDDLSLPPRQGADAGGSSSSVSQGRSLPAT